MTVRLLTTGTRRRLEEIISRLKAGQTVSLKERVHLAKYSIHIPFIARKITQAIQKRKSLDADGLL